jgi:hypothetical protein
MMLPFAVLPILFVAHTAATDLTGTWTFEWNPDFVLLRDRRVKRWVGADSELLRSVAGRPLTLRWLLRSTTILRAVASFSPVRPATGPRPAPIW